MHPPPGTHLYVFNIPAVMPLGCSDQDFSNVHVGSYNFDDGQSQACTSELFFACTGKLGTLAQGLLHLPDDRQPLTSGALQELRVAESEEAMEKKRTDRFGDNRRCWLHQQQHQKQTWK